MRDLNDLMIGPKKSGVPSVPPAPKIAPEPEEIPTLKRMKGGMVAGAFAGFVAAKFYMDWQASDTPVGTFHEGNVLLLFAVCVGGGAAVGAGIGCLAANCGGGGNVPPPSDLLR